MILLQCDGCGCCFSRESSLHRSNVKRGRMIVACSNKCVGVVVSRQRSGDKRRTCEECEQFFIYNDPEQRFCGRSCSSISIGRSRRKERKQEIKLRGIDYCTVTLQEVLDKYGRSQFHAKVRGNSRSVYAQSGQPLVCQACGYDLHVDICHIIDVKDFSMDTPVCEVNSIDNLVALDKRCHWEFDHGYLKL